MSEPRLRHPPHWSTPLRMHLGILGRFWGIWILLAALFTPLIVFLQLRIDTAERILASRARETGESVPEGIVPLLRETGDIPIFAEIFPLLGIGIFTWALLVWYEEPWGGRDYIWSLPADRPANDLWRVTAGAVWLFAGIAFAVALGIVLAFISGQKVFVPGSGPLWISFVTSSLLVYLLVSIPAVVSRAPLLWIVGVLTVLPLASVVAYLMGSEHITVFLWMVINGGRDLEGVATLTSALLAGFQRGMTGWSAELGQDRGLPLTPWLLSVALWTGVAATGVVLAARRRR